MTGNRKAFLGAERRRRYELDDVPNPDSGQVSSGASGDPVSIELDAVFSVHGDVHWTDMDDELVLVNLNNGSYYTLNRVGRAIWQQIDGARPLHAVLDEVVSRYRVSKEQAGRDLLAMVEDLEKERLLTRESPIES